MKVMFVIKHAKVVGQMGQRHASFARHLNSTIFVLSNAKKIFSTEITFI
jgi:hypothetical protein